MREIPLNWLAILAAAAVRMVIGFLWYSPVAFGPMFMRSTGCTEGEMKARLPAALASDAVGALIMSFILVHAVIYAGAKTIATGRLKPVVDRIFPLAEAAAAHGYLESGAQFGKVVLKV